MPDLSVTLDSSTVPVGGGTVSASVRIQPGTQGTAVDRHLVLCVDTSGSMAGEKIEQVREGIRWVFGYLDDDDTVGIVSFDDVVEVVLPATRWGDLDREDADAAVDRLTASGGTDILAGLEAAHETLAGLRTGPDVARRILLLSDGRDETPLEAFTDLARRARREDDIAIPAAGIGEFYDEAVVRAVGTASAGEWVHLSRPTDIENFFGRKVDSLQTVVASSPSLELELGDGVDVEEVLLRRPQVRDVDAEFADGVVRVHLPDLVEFELQELVLRFETPSCSDGAAVPLADIRLNTRTGSTTTTVEVTGAAGVDDVETRIEDPEVSLAYMDTVVRKATSEGDVATAETVVEQATEVHGGDEVGGLDTVIEDANDDLGALETVIESTDEDDADEVGALDTVIGDTTGDEREAQYLTTKIQDGS